MAGKVQVTLKMAANRATGRDIVATVASCIAGPQQQTCHQHYIVQDTVRGEETVQACMEIWKKDFLQRVQALRADAAFVAEVSLP